MDGMDDLLKDFIVECSEGLDQLDRDLIFLEKDPTSEEVLGRVFRTIHTIKGSSGFLGLEKLQAITHGGETLLSKLRDREIDLSADRITGLLSMADAVRSIVGHLENDRGEGKKDYDSLVDRLTFLTDSPSSSLSPSPTPLDPVSEERIDEAPRAGVESERRLEPEAQRPSISESTIRVDVGLLDTLMNLVGELVLARNQILQHTSTQSNSNLNGTTQRLNLVTTELQEGVMKTRMQPIGKIWNKLPRVVRDLAISCGKDVRIEMEGRDTELDKTIIEAIKDPLTHAIRNSVDHGVEAPELRRERGKPAQGCIALRAFHEGGHVNIEISDDGGGIDHERVRAKAIARGVVTRERASRLTEKELLNLITLPGFSTAAEITNVSGRGVGMDVVRTNIEKISGSVDIQSVPGRGTTLKVKIPLTLAIIPALIVTSGEYRFAIPQVDLLELLRLEGHQLENGLEDIHGTPVYRLRGTLLPLVYLDEVLETRLPNPRRSAKNQDDEKDLVVSIVVVQAGERPFGLVVETILDTEEIVVKPLGQQLKGASTFAGAAIMGDGKVALILDVLGVGQRARIVEEGRESTTSSTLDTNVIEESHRENLLLVAWGKEKRAAIPLSAVARLEEFEATQLESTSEQEVVQYRGEIMPILRLSKTLGSDDEAPSNNSRMQVVVIRTRNHSVGLAVHAILDILDDEIKVVRHSAKRGIHGAIAVKGRVTDLIDVDDLIAHELPGLVETAENAGV